MKDVNLKNGQILVFMVFFITTAIIVGGMVVDVGMMHWQQQRMKRTADAAALAGAPDINTPTAARDRALDYASRNGFTNGIKGTTITTQINPTGLNPNWFRVTIQSPFHFIFGKIIGLNSHQLKVASSAQYNTSIPINIALGGVYGEDNPDVTLAIRGHNTLYEHGDPRATMTYDDGRPNPLYDPEGYNYQLYVPTNYAAINGTSIMHIYIWDADSAGNYDSSGTTTTTTYKIYRPDLTPNDYSDDVLIGTYTKGGSSTTLTNNKWYQPSGWVFDTAILGRGKYRINVSVSSGYNANGFSLYAGPETASPFNPNNGTKILADGPLCIRFNTTGAVEVQLGTVPASGAGARMHINKFDTDIGSTQCQYTCDSLTQTWTGQLAGNSEWKEDVITIPSNYTGGTWWGHYNAGITDVSYWELWFEGLTTGQTGFAILVE